MPDFNQMEWRVCKKRTADPNKNCMNPWHTYHRTHEKTVYWSSGVKKFPKEEKGRKWWR